MSTKSKKSRRSRMRASGGTAEKVVLPSDASSDGEIPVAPVAVGAPAEAITPDDSDSYSGATPPFTPAVPSSSGDVWSHEKQQTGSRDLEANFEDLEEIVLGIRGIRPLVAVGALVGLVALAVPIYAPYLVAHGLQAIGPLLGIALIVFSLFGDLPKWVSWTQRLGAWLYPGIVIGTIAVLAPMLIPRTGGESSFWAFSPLVWLAYLFIVLVSLSFEQSSLPSRVYWFFQTRALPPAILVPMYTFIAGLLGNILDGVSIIAISVVIFRRLLPKTWATQASFALLFGGLLSNFLTVAAEPTNIKFQDVLAPLLDRVKPSFWLTNWPISILAVSLTTLYLGVAMWRARISWLTEDSSVDTSAETEVRTHRFELFAGFAAVVLLAAGIVAHSIMQVLLNLSSSKIDLPLGLFLAPAGIAAFWHLRLVRVHVRRTKKIHFTIPLRSKSWVHRSRLPATWKHIQFEVPIWIKLAVIFSLLWYIANGLTQSTSAFSVFFEWPEALRFGAMSLLSLASSITDNVALAAMQGSLLLQHPLTIWQIRFLFIVLTWAGGFTPFGCLQSLALNSRLQISTSTWFKQAIPWGIISIVGALAGLALIDVFYPDAVRLPGLSPSH